MKTFGCQACAQIVFFENDRCENCQRVLGFIPERETMTALEPEGEGWRALEDKAPYHRCANAEHQACNWLVPAGGAEILCRACRHNHTIPDLSMPENLNRWRELERAKRYLFYSLLRFDLPIATRAEDPKHGLMFEFPADNPAPDASKVMTGHADGVITLALNEADAGERESRRCMMGETYRTLLGHFRHEIGHYYWDVLVQDGERLDEFRRIFGDERADYAAALKAHYDNGPAPNWQNAFVTAYASTHPWEDFAETFAHYLHIVDTLETAGDFGLRIRPETHDDPALKARIDFDAYEARDIDLLMKTWIPVTIAVNSLNRSMGQPDLYPFVLSVKAIEKLGFVLDLIRPKEGARQSSSLPAPAAKIAPKIKTGSEQSWPAAATMTPSPQERLAV